MMERDKRTPELIESVMRFSQSNDFWKGNILSPDKLRKNFDQLTVKMNTNKGVKNDGHKPIDPDKW